MICTSESQQTDVPEPRSAVKRTPDEEAVSCFNGLPRHLWRAAPSPLAREEKEREVFDISSFLPPLQRRQRWGLARPARCVVLAATEPLIWPWLPWERWCGGVTIYGRYFTTVWKGRSTLPQRGEVTHCPIDLQQPFHYRGCAASESCLRSLRRRVRTHVSWWGKYHNSITSLFQVSKYLNPKDPNIPIHFHEMKLVLDAIYGLHFFTSSHSKYLHS